MADFNPTERIDDLLGRKSVALAYDEAERWTRETAETSPELSALWAQVRDGLKERLDAEVRAESDAEAARLAELTAAGNKSYAEFCKSKGIKAPK